MNRTLKNKGLILFDGYCYLCSYSVEFILKRDTKDYFRFVSLQSEIGQEYLLKYNISVELNNSVILIENSVVYVKSTAALRIAGKIKGLWFLFYVFFIIPKAIRDYFYMIVSDNRFKWFGKKDKCYIPNESYKLKFL